MKTEATGLAYLDRLALLREYRKSYNTLLSVCGIAGFPLAAFENPLIGYPPPGASSTLPLVVRESVFLP